MRRSRQVSAHLGVLVLAAACAGCGLRERARGFFEDKGSRTVVLRIGERSYSRADLEHFFDNRLSDLRDPAGADEVKSNLLESFIEDRLLLIEAEKHGIEADPAALNTALENIAAGSAGQRERADPRRDEALVRDLGDSLKARIYLNRHVLGDVRVSDEECEKYYLEHIGEYVVNDRVRLREILVDGQAEAERLLDALKQSRGKNFAELARARSKASAAADGGMIGVFQRGELPEEFEKAVFSLPAGSISRPVRTRYGYHLFLVEERVAAHQQRIWEVREDIRRRLRAGRERERIENEIRRLAASVPIALERENLGFNYIGARFADK